MSFILDLMLQQIAGSGFLGKKEKKKSKKKG
jgi:hypothetical protein